MNMTNEGMKDYAFSKLSKGEKTKLRILEGAVVCIVKHGFEGASITELTEASGVNRTSINHYFQSKDALIDETFPFVMMGGRAFTNNFMNGRGDISDLIFRYAQATMAWFREYPLHGSFLYLCMQKATYDSKMKAKINDHFKKSHHRLQTLIKGRIPNGTTAKEKAVAEQIHGVLVGLMLSSSNLDAKMIPVYEKHCLDIISAIVKYWKLIDL